MKLYHYHDLTPPDHLAAAFARVTAALRAGDFRAADVKKMVGTPYYRARLSDADRRPKAYPALTQLLNGVCSPARVR